MQFQLQTFVVDDVSLAAHGAPSFGVVSGSAPVGCPLQICYDGHANSDPFLWRR